MLTYSRLNIALLFAVSVCFGSIDLDPKNAGTTQTKNAVGDASNALYCNPALLGVERSPRGNLQIAPLTNFAFGVWSDKLALSPLLDYYFPWGDSLKQSADMVSSLFLDGFKLDGLNPHETSEKLTKKLEGGIKLYAGARFSLLNIAYNRIGFDITTHYDETFSIPEGPLFAIFSETKGLQRGNSLDFSNLKQESILATDLTFNIGLPVEIPALHKLFRLEKGAGGLGIKWVLGHSVLKATTEEGTLKYDTTNGEQLNVNGKIHIQTAGHGYRRFWSSGTVYPDFENLGINGHGVGVDLGGILYDDHGSLTINFQNIGAIFWLSNIREVTYEIRKDDLDYYDIVRGVDETPDDEDPKLRIFNRNEGEYISTKEDFEKGNGFVTMLPLGINVGYGYKWDFSRDSSKQKRFWANNITASANYEQQFPVAPIRSWVPRLSFGGEIGTVNGYLPLRMGFIAGGPEVWASALGASFNFKYISINAAYKAIGNWWFYPKRGIEVAGGMGVNWGFNNDKDKDGILDKDDKCPTNPEDKDGFQDEDGCPELDNDNDGIVDVKDKCVNVPEDKDAFEDEDGCPEFDNDNDKIVDSLDKCPNEPEDMDSFQDQDGCPELDNDADGIADKEDRCPNVAEDIDMFEDTDGCPDFDNDRDGIADSLDRCINDPETFNSYKDEDGCPDSLIKPTEKETKVLNTKLRSINFKTNSAELMSASYDALNYVVGFLGLYPHLRYEIQGHTDSQGEDTYNLLLSAARAGTVRAYLLSKGVPDSNLIAIGYGETRPIADNGKSSGRALNRRVEFKVVETNDEYNALKVQEQIFRERVREAKIKGVR